MLESSWLGANGGMAHEGDCIMGAVDSLVLACRTFLEAPRSRTQDASIVRGSSIGVPYLFGSASLSRAQDASILEPQQSWRLY